MKQNVKYGIWSLTPFLEPDPVSRSSSPRMNLRSTTRERQARSAILKTRSVNCTASPEANDVVLPEALSSNARSSRSVQKKVIANIVYLNTFRQGWISNN